MASSTDTSVTSWFPTESFEVDGIVYIPPVRGAEPEKPSEWAEVA